MLDNKIEEKIRQLLAMAEHPNSNEHEAAIAMQKAQDLLLKNNLTRADISIEGNSTQAPGIGKLDITMSAGYVWKRHLLHTLAINSLCRTVSTPSMNRTTIFGTYENVRGVIEMNNWLVPELERIAMRAWDQYKRDGTGREKAQTWKKGFFLGAIRVIGGKLKESMREFEAGPGHAIVPYNTGLVNDALRRVFPFTRAGKIKSGSYDGMAAGRMAGNGINLRPQHKISGVRALTE